MHRNILHYMVSYAGYHKVISQRLDEILRNGVDKSCVDQQDVDLNTPIHLAVLSGNHYYAYLLESNGADLHLKNKRGQYVGAIEGEEKEKKVEKPQLTNIFIQKSINNNDVASVNDSNSSKMEDQIDHIIKIIGKNIDDLDTLDYKPTDTDAPTHQEPRQVERQVVKATKTDNQLTDSTENGVSISLETDEF